MTNPAIRTETVPTAPQAEVLTRAAALKVALAAIDRFDMEGPRQ